MLYHSISGYTFIAKFFLLANIIVNGSSQILPIQIVYSVTAKYPLTLCDIIVTQFPCMFEYAIKNSPMDRNITTNAKIQCLRRKNFSDISRNLIRFLFFVIIGFALSFRLVISFNKFTSFINIYFALNVLASRSLQIIRSLQSIHGL